MSTEERLSRLERENRLLKRGFMGLAVAAAAAVLMGQAAPPRPPQPAAPAYAQLLRVKRLEIIGDNGVPVVILGQQRSYGHIAVTNPAGRALVSLGTTRSGKGFISTYDGRDIRLAAIGATREGAGAIVVYNAQGKNQVRIAENPQKKEGTITLFNAQGGVRAQWPQPQPVKPPAR
ncbi:MAG: hypothetical protein HYZ11_12920 [Candidatus Tectomicrobia bacterium]|uniref:Uncharacterized protein n=1 Tax=Tectimicrobiota bacterium TaxID=2528274 RepID=A0A932MQW7_UNCTE|nr:hypothetical protein [Candidatus Tectomicrobia bacterium]